MHWQVRRALEKMEKLGFATSHLNTYLKLYKLYRYTHAEHEPFLQHPIHRRHKTLTTIKKKKIVRKHAHPQLLISDYVTVFVYRLVLTFYPRVFKRKAERYS